MTADQLSAIPIAPLGDWTSRSRAVDADGVLWFIWTDHDGNRWRFKA